MDLPNVQVDPNLNADAYRNMTAGDIPPIIDKHLEFVLVFDDDSAVLGASNMTDRYWSGTAWFYNQVASFDRDKCTAAMKTESGICDGAFFGERDKFVIGEDSGVIQILGVVEMADTRTHELQCLGYSCQHDDGLTSISAFNNNLRLVTGGLDFCIKVWDMEELISPYTFNPAHTDIVSGVDAQPTSDSVFASSSLDCEALVWDLRQRNPASSIFQTECGLTSVAWSHCEEYVVAIGAVDGSIALIDVRQPGSTPLHQSPAAFTRGVHRLRFDPNRPHHMAGCCDGTEVRVFDTTKELKVIYEDNRHKDFVRGLTWHNSQLVTCSWDDTVLKHSPPS